MINHIVLFKFKKSLKKEDISHLFSQIQKLSEFFPKIQNFSWGPNNNGEGLTQGFQYSLFLQFDSKETRTKYENHPFNKQISEKVVRPALEKGIESAIVFDFDAPL